MHKTAFLFIAICTPCLVSAQMKVPFVGCVSDGQVGPQEAPKGEPVAVRISADAAKQLAYYKAGTGDFGVLGPRCWYCFGLYGSGGDSLFLSPQPLTSRDLFSSNWRGLTGIRHAVSHSLGGTSGRSVVAAAIARVFPSHRNFVDGIVASDLARKSDFHFGPYPADKLTYKSKEMHSARYTQEGRLEMNARRYAVVIERTSTGYAAWSPDVSGCCAAGDTEEETRGNFQDALAAHFEVRREVGEPIPEPTSSVDYVEVAA